MPFNLKNRVGAKVGAYHPRYVYSSEQWFEGFGKQEKFKQEFSVVDSERLIEKLKKDFKSAKKQNTNFCDGFVEGFREGYLYRGKEILGEVDK